MHAAWIGQSSVNLNVDDRGRMMLLFSVGCHLLGFLAAVVISPRDHCHLIVTHDRLARTGRALVSPSSCTPSAGQTPASPPVPGLIDAAFFPIGHGPRRWFCNCHDGLPLPRGDAAPAPGGPPVGRGGDDGKGGQAPRRCAAVGPRTPVGRATSFRRGFHDHPSLRIGLAARCRRG